VKYLFGPIPSRRLGLSLGVDLVPYKVCSFDCIYCEIGRTTLKTTERKEYVPFDEVKREIDLFISQKGYADFITLSGSGEPTLHIKTGELINWIKTQTDIPVAVITNASLLWDPRVREELYEAHVVLPSLDAGTQEIFEKINRPHFSITLEKILHGLEIFCHEFEGEIWFEVLLVKGVNDSLDEIKRLSNLLRGIPYNKIQLNTVVRPPAQKVEPLTQKELEALLPYFGEKSEVIAFSSKKTPSFSFDIEDQIAKTVSRRPCTRKDIAKMLGISELEVTKYIDTLLYKDKIKIKRHKDEIFYIGKEGK